MPATASLTDFNRNPNALLDEARASGRPLYLTKNGKACAVVMDPDAFERVMTFREELLAREMRVYSGILQGFEDVQEGRTTSAEEGLAALRSKKGW